MNRFKITKIGLLNFWLYDEEEYDFYGGKLILRGGNGSGKSVTLQSFIPLILDGNKSPERLDPFGSKERKIEDYVLGNTESVQKEEATSYLYMETYNEKENKYITIGLGLRGRKGKPIESWGFALKDGKRINKDFFLYKDPSNKIPLSKNELKARLGTINEIALSTKDYKAMVNRLLFGFPNLETYDEFIKLLLQLRSNKLSKEYRPTDLVNVLNTVLQPLSEDDLRPLSEAIEQMNKTKEQVETLEKNSKSLKEFLKVYKRYNEIVLLTKARNYKKENDNYLTLEKKIRDLTKELDNLKENLNTKNERFNKVLLDIEVNSEIIKELDNKDLKQKIDSLTSISENIKSLEQKLVSLEQNLSKNEEERLKLNTKISEKENDIYKLKKDIEETVVNLKDLSSESYFDEIVFFSDDLLENINNNISFNSIFMSLKNYREKISFIKNLLEEEEKILLESESLRLEYEKLSNLFKELEKEKMEKEKKLKESVLNWEEEFISTINTNAYLKPDEKLKTQIFNLMNNYVDETYDKVKELYLNYARGLISEITIENLKLESKITNKSNELDILKNEYEQIENQKGIELESLNEESDRVLKENNIESIPLYKCIEFKDNISEKVKDKLESTLLDLNILNAKIFKSEDISKVEKLNIQVLYLTKSTKKKNNLLKYFNIKLENNIFKEKEIEEILQSISIDKKDLFYINEDISKLEVLNSIGNTNYTNSYIGYLKREEIKQNKLKDLSEKIEVLSSEITGIKNLINSNNDKISKIELESSNLPTNDEIINIENSIKELNISLDWNDKREKSIEEEISKVDTKLKEIKDKIDINKQGIYIPLNTKTYNEVLNILFTVNETVQNLKNGHSNYLNLFDMINSFKERLNDITNSISYLNEEKYEKEKQLQINIKNKETITELLETKEYKNQREKLETASQNLINLSKEKDILIKEITKLETDIEYKTNSLNDENVNISSLEKSLRTYKEIFLREYNLNYIYDEEISNIDNIVLKIIKEGKDKKDISINDALNSFYSSYNHYSLELNDYSLRSTTLFSDYETEDEIVKSIYEANTRADVTAMYQGFKVNIIELSKKLEDDILESKDLISKQDRHLFEDILLNTVGVKIRDRINSSNEWVSKINSIMSKMQENSALSFKLVWKSITAESENEIDTRELVRILKMDPKLLKDSDAEKLTNHFRSKIKKAEELYQDSFISFYKIIEEILDYRSWFTFQLLYQRKGMNQKELTDKIHSKFSGGERAKSMYIPLFASVYAKLNLAKENSLRIIALDEAFAGVDEDNIREMFGILKYLDIDYIINSQVLWGDYDTIDDISICEIIRPANSQVVSVERYRWNGKYKEIINDRNSYNKENENA